MDTLGDDYILIPQDFGMIRKNRYWLYLASTQKKALILKGIRAFSNFAF